MALAHAAFALIAILLGGLQLFRRKGDRLHRLAGRGYVAAMVLAALTSFFLTTMTGSFSFLHILSVWTLGTLGISHYCLRRGRIEAHARSMILLYGGLLTAGVLAAQRHGLDLPPAALGGVLLLVWAPILLLTLLVRRRLAGAV